MCHMAESNTLQHTAGRGHIAHELISNPELDEHGEDHL